MLLNTASIIMQFFCERRLWNKHTHIFEFSLNGRMAYLACLLWDRRRNAIYHDQLLLNNVTMLRHENLIVSTAVHSRLTLIFQNWKVTEIGRFFHILLLPRAYMKKNVSFSIVQYLTKTSVYASNTISSIN